MQLAADRIEPFAVQGLKAIDEARDNLLFEAGIGELLENLPSDLLYLPDRPFTQSVKQPLLLAIERLPQLLAEFFLGITDNPTVFLLLIAILMLILGTVIDATAILVLVVPILLPLVRDYGIDPIAAGVLMIVSLMVGLLTPPVGTVLFVTASVSKTRVGEVFRGSLPFLIPSLAIMLLLILVPDWVMWLPGVLGL